MTTPTTEATRAAERICETFDVGEHFTREFEYHPSFEAATPSTVATLIDAEYAALRERVERLEQALMAYVAVYGGINNGKCRECGRERYCDTEGRRQPCANPRCLSNRAAAALDYSEEPTP